MKLEHESQMFLHAVQNLLSTRSAWRLHAASWLRTLPVADVEMFVGWPRDTRFKRHAAVAWCFSGTQYAALAMEYNPDFVLNSNGHTFFLYEDGYDVMAGSGALATLRREAESEVLQ